jgi:hypothetical protein
MIYYRHSSSSKTEIGIFTEEEMKVMGKPLTSEGKICKGFYLNMEGLTLQQLVEAIDLEDRGVYDYAVPQKWAEMNNFPKAVWFYPYEGENKMFGRPYYVSTMLCELKEEILEKALSLWNDSLKEVSDD